MNIPIKYYPNGQIAHPEPYVKAGVLHFDLNFKCDHELAVVVEDDVPTLEDEPAITKRVVLCVGCNNTELSDEDIDAILIADLVEGDDE